MKSGGRIPRLGFLNAMSVANVQGIASIPSVGRERRLGAVPEHTLSEIFRAPSFALDLDS